MAELLIEGLAETVTQRLRERAKRNGRSLEAEARSVLEEAAAVESTKTPQRYEETGFGTLMHERFGKNGLTPEEAVEFDKAIEELRRGGKPREPDLT